MTQGMMGGLLDADVVTAVGFTAFDPATAHQANVTNSNLTVTSADTTSGDQGAHVLDSSAKNTGKYYFEVTINAIASNNLASVLACGVAVVGDAYTEAGSTTTTQADMLHCIPGTIYAGGGSVASLGSLNNAGNIIGIAVDLVNRAIWFRGVGGPIGVTLWNGAVLNGDPAANTGGVGLPAGSLEPYVCFGGTGGAAGDQFTANFGGSAFTGAAPAGFTSGWPI